MWRLCHADEAWRPFSVRHIQAFSRNSCASFPWQGYREYQVQKLQKSCIMLCKELSLWYKRIALKKYGLRSSRLLDINFSLQQSASKEESLRTFMSTTRSSMASVHLLKVFFILLYRDKWRILHARARIRISYWLEHEKIKIRIHKLILHSIKQLAGNY